MQVTITKESLAPSLPKPWTTFSFRRRTGLVEESKCAELCDRFAKVLPVPGAADSLELDQPCTIHPHPRLARMPLTAKGPARS